jgi:SNF2 family DNA or RNA helicase
MLRQLSLDPSLVGDEYADIPSSKLDVVMEQLSSIVDSGHRVLVFSQFTRFLGRARDRLDTLGIGHCQLDGKTRNRAEVIERFQAGAAPVFLISLKAGGFGLNLTEADYCILLDPWWNPAAEAQAIDRTHRIGQTKSVMVYRYVAKATIEEKVMALKAGKARLFNDVLGKGDGSGAARVPLTAAEIRELIA